MDRFGNVCAVEAVPTVPDDIDEDVLLELLTVVDGKLDHLIHLLRLITVDVDDWRLDRFGNVCAVEAASSLGRGSGEPDLVVCHNVDHAVDVVVVKVGHLQTLVDNTLTCYRRVSMNEHP